MKFTTSCFVCVRDVEKRRDLIRWLCGIGRPHRKVVPLDVFPFIVAYDGWHDNVSIESINIYQSEIPDLIDCGENIELFKALAAMLDKAWDRQYVIDNAGNMGFCEVIPDARGVKCRCVTMLGLAFNIDNYRKATAEEIIKYFKTRGK